MRLRIAALIIPSALVAICLAGCDNNPLTKISSLENTIHDQNVRIDSLEAKLRKAEIKLIFLELSKNSYESAVFDPATDEGFSRIDTSVGSFAVSVQEVKPHADGVRVRLHVGNLTSATISGGTITAKWGPRMPKSEGDDLSTKYDEWEKRIQEKKINFTQELRPGSWNNVTITLPSTPAEQFGYLELALDTSQIKLFTVR